MENQDFININWDDHAKSFISEMSNDAEQDTLKDVTLACANGDCIRAHRLILSIYSEYFQNFLANCTTSEPTILLPEIELQDLKTLISFMYTGKVNTSEENLPNIIKAATKLQIKGLVDNKPDIEEGPSAKKRRIDYDSDDSLTAIASLPREKKDENLNIQNSYEPNPVFPYMQWLMMNQMQTVPPPYSMLPELPRVSPNVHSPQSHMEESSKDHHECNVCHRFFDKHTSLMSHTRYNHMPMKTPKYCCGQPFPTRWDLKLHKTEHSSVQRDIANSIESRLDMSRSLMEEDSDSKLVIDI